MSLQQLLPRLATALAHQQGPQTTNTSSRRSRGRMQPKGQRADDSLACRHGVPRSAQVVKSPSCSCSRTRPPCCPAYKMFVEPAPARGRGSSRALRRGAKLLADVPLSPVSSSLLSLFLLSSSWGVCSPSVCLACAASSCRSRAHTTRSSPHTSPACTHTQPSSTRRRSN